MNYNSGIVWKVYRWFLPWWWKYLFTNCEGWSNFWCRVSEHKCGVIWYNYCGDEPDMCCKNCGEDFG